MHDAPAIHVNLAAIVFLVFVFVIFDIDVDVVSDIFHVVVDDAYNSVSFTFNEIVVHDYVENNMCFILVNVI